MLGCMMRQGTRGEGHRQPSSCAWRRALKDKKHFDKKEG